MKTVFTLLIIAFSFTMQAEDNRLTANFEKYFGSNGSKNLNNTVSEFDLFLENQYGSLKPAERFKKYLNELISGEAFEWKMKTVNGNEIADSIFMECNYENKDEVKKDSPLFGQRILFLPDTVYREGNVIKSIYTKPFKITQSGEVPKNKYLESNMALIAADAKKGYNELFGKEQFKNALNKIKDENILVGQYTKAKNQNEQLSISEVSKLILKSAAENEYFAKRILVWEMNE